MKKLLILLGLTAILLAGCGGEEAGDTTGTDSTDSTTSASVPPLSIPSGKQEAVVPEEGDIVIPINP